MPRNRPSSACTKGAPKGPLIPYIYIQMWVRIRFSPRIKKNYCANRKKNSHFCVWGSQISGILTKNDNNYISEGPFKGQKWPYFWLYLTEKWVIFKSFYPLSGGVWYGPQGPWKRGSEGPQDPQNRWFWVILALFGSKMANPLVFGLKWGQKTPPKPTFSWNFVKSLGTPLGFWIFAKKRLVFGLKFSKTFEKSWKKGPFLANPGILGPLTAYLGSRGPICLVNTLNHQLFLALAMWIVGLCLVQGKGHNA